MTQGRAAEMDGPRWPTSTVGSQKNYGQRTYIWENDGGAVGKGIPVGHPTLSFNREMCVNIVSTFLSLQAYHESKWT